MTISAQASEWPARAYIYGTWDFALSQARDRARRFTQRMYLYQSTLDGDSVWVVSWDPKRGPR